MKQEKGKLEFNNKKLNKNGKWSIVLVIIAIVMGLFVTHLVYDTYKKRKFIREEAPAIKALHKAENEIKRAKDLERGVDGEYRLDKDLSVDTEDYIYFSYDEIQAEINAGINKDRNLKSKKNSEITKETKSPMLWNEVIRFTGSNMKNTKKFDISSNEWRIKWDTEPGKHGDMNFQIYLHGTDGFPQIIANIIGKGNDETYIYEKGTYYMTINTSQPYTIVVEEYR